MKSNTGGSMDKRITLRRAKRWDVSCDNCDGQEGGHYCLLHGLTVRNMDTKTCAEWMAKETEAE